MLCRLMADFDVRELERVEHLYYHSPLNVSAGGDHGDDFDAHG